MNANQTSPPDLLPPPESPEAAGTRARRSLADRILAWSFLASVVVNVAWVALVSHSNLFGGGVVPPTREHPVKVFKPIPVKPKPKKKELPPPPPPRQHKITPPKPLKPIIHPPRPTPPRPAPPLHRMNVATTHNKAAVSPIIVPETAPNPDVVRPTASGDSPVVTPPAPPPPPAPVYHAPPAPPAPVYHAPPAPPAPVVHPRGWVPIDTQEASQPDGLGGDVSTDGIEASTITNGKVVISFTIDETGRFRNARIKESCGNSELDNRYLAAVQRGRGTPAIQDHIPRDQPSTYTFPVGT